MTKEMQLNFIILVIYCFLSTSKSTPSPQDNPEWKQSRFIIDNRKTVLFSAKPALYFLQQPTQKTPQRFSNKTFKRRLLPPNRFQKDLSAEASILETNYYPKYNDKTTSSKIIRPQNYLVRGFDDKNASTQSNFIQNERIVRVDEVSGGGSQDPNLSLDEVWAWMPKIDEDVWVSVSSSKATVSQQKTPHPGTENPLPRGSPTAISWGLRSGKAEESNQIDKSMRFSNPNEKHVYETRIETVSYHKEMILNPQHVETSSETSWYGTRTERAEEASEVGNYQKDESSATYVYEEPERNYEEEEKNYEEPERNYEEPERNYEEPERNYEEPEKNYEEPEKSYAVDKASMISNRTPENEENRKFGYVVEGNNYRRYRVEERTADGFIVGEYGVVSHDDGSLRGVRYTADSTTNPQLIYDSLLKFLSL